MREIKTNNYKIAVGNYDAKSIVLPEKLSKEELISAIRLSIAAEHDAVILYESYANSTDSEAARKVFQHVADEEKVHVGEFHALLNSLMDGEDDKFNEGKEEAEEYMHASNKGSLSKRAFVDVNKYINSAVGLIRFQGKSISEAVAIVTKNHKEIYDKVMVGVQEHLTMLTASAGDIAR